MPLAVTEYERLMLAALAALLALVLLLALF